MTYLNNPAGRLLMNFQLVRQQAPATRALQAWSSVFNIDSGDMNAFMQRVSKLYEWAEQTQEMINDSPTADPRIHLKHFGEVQNALSNFLAVRELQVEQFLTPIHPNSGEYCLEICAHLLHSQRAEPSLDPDERESLLSRLDRLIDEVVQDGDLDQETKDWVLRRLSKIRDTLFNAHLFSTEDTEHALDVLLGGLRRKLKVLRSLTKTVTGKNLMTFVVALDLAINLSANTHELIAGDPPRSSPIVIEIQKVIDPPALPEGKNDSIEAK
ncbi:hypothetical protein FKR81_04425 [Lentzea tibetensis]|uniref:Uncharacterized protein n=1 Tax=Lentzea tibetensis TaxID=2591470 RepID=A0A563F0B1_9PSEU|nr:hypothetical protein [Lentzea tibetensis]TWP53222.1 hypothetical protein FKR81_04425 [Lentzea tibetensis]